MCMPGKLQYLLCSVLFLCNISAGRRG
ncbi:RepA leader peptide Tap [Pantoea sp. BAV 3049]